jgi:RNA polymerase sigma-70 factor (ECF subfamily)
LEKAKRYDEEAITALYKHFYPRIYRYIAFRVSDKEMAKDLTAEVFVRMIDTIKSVRSSLQAWLYRVANNLVIDYYRTKGKAASNEANADESTLSTRDHAPRILNQELLRKALLKLSADAQTVINLKFTQGYTNQEIAEVIGKSEGAVKVIQFRALRRLKELIQ